MVKKRIKYYRIYFGVISVFVLIVLIGVFAKIWFYFNSGADRSIALNLSPILPEAHVPYIRWLEDDPETGRVMENFSRGEIMKDYIRGWYQVDQSMFTGDTGGLKEYFTSAALPRILENVREIKSGSWLLSQTDLRHFIKLHFYSADGQIVAFTDKNLLIKQRIYRKKDRKNIYRGEQLADYDVVMLLDDGYWRIKNIVRKIPDTIDKDTNMKDNADMVQVRGRHFFLNDSIFHPAGINYYPQETPWKRFWSNYDPEVTRKDFNLIRQLGFNTVRIFINYYDFNKGDISEVRLSQLKDLLDQAGSTNLKVIVTLFDFIGDYSLPNFTASDRQLETLLTRFKNHPSILAWDLKNEPDLDFIHQDKDDVREWLEWIIKNAREYDANHLMTIGWASAENAHLYGHLVDFVSFHSYRPIEELETDVKKLTAAVIDKPLVLEEFGLSTYRGIWSPYGPSEQNQSEYFSRVKRVLTENGDLGFMLWTLYDFNEIPSDIAGGAPWIKNPQKYFGIIKQNGKLKEGATIWK